MQYRTYKDSEVKLSVIGFGGICVMNESSRDAKRIVDTAIERGITYFDVAPSYGNAEQMLGPALEPHRDNVFLACKSNKRDAPGVKKEFAQSLENLRTDRFDLYQIHAIESQEQVDQVLAPGGALEAIQEEREKGRLRYIGFSAHNEEAALRLLDSFDFDSVLFPVNRYVWYTGGVGPRVVDRAQRQGTAILALKSLAARRWHDGEEKTWSKTWYKPLDTSEEIETAVRFTLSRPVLAAVSPGHEELLWMACDAADRFVPLTADEEEQIAGESPVDGPVFSTHVVAI